MENNTSDNKPQGHLDTQIHSGEGAAFDGLTTYPRKKGNITKNNTTGEMHGICERCGNYSSHLSDMGYCPICEDWLEKNKSAFRQKKYIKAGSRSHLDL